MTSKVIILEDGFRILDINCDQCGTHFQITHEDVCVRTCFCGKQYFNSAYYYINKDGIIDFNEYYWIRKEKKK